MSTGTPSWLFDDRRMRAVFAALATLISAGALVIRNEPAVDWSLLAPTVVVFWLWAAIDRFPAAPVYLLGLTVPFVLNIIESEEESSMFLVVLTVAIIASVESKRAVAVALVVSSLIAAIVLGLSTAIQDFSIGNWVAGILFSWGAGEMVYRFSRMIDELQHARHLVADRAAVHERRRIARDVHDMVGHSLSVVMLHVTGARHLVHKDPDEAERALEQAEQAGRQSLAEIRRTVGLLRDADDGESAVVPSADLNDLPDLVLEFVAAGQEVTLDMTGQIEALGPATALAGYRIAQEALTNVSRHTVGSMATVTVRVGGEDCEIAIVNQGGEVLVTDRGSSYGLISMRERARSVGGSLIAGPTSSGWSVEAILPLQQVGSIR